MSAPATIQEPNRLSTLPPEIFFKIPKETTQKEECWINIVTKDESPCCKNKGAYSSLIFTKGKAAQDPRSSPFDHECTFERPVADGKIENKAIGDEIWELDLRANRLKNQLNVYERSLGPDIVDNVRSLWLRIENEEITLDELRLICQHFPVFYKGITEVLPSTDADLPPHDLTWRKSHKQLKPLLLNMSQHLKLKTLVVLDNGTFKELSVLALLMGFIYEKSNDGIFANDDESTTSAAIEMSRMTLPNHLAF
ncbi:hypothetical protein FLAG1_01005 [Fusarium langsethiae]|uniref:Uncharacterized protein n=1 Tax=Fusarium langsethiae TaxID=179993 RepID=A0A0M9F4V2_FUSLA|nr:hypothetical protein FLAG1_01005 [Fusarium langsethiae]GKT98283.1 unnamed protein product [Fusarium langsethiae]GKU12733.1 unnamed protein product [Fusarium langsethiae]